MRSLSRLAILTEELALQYSPIILKALSCMQQLKASQPDSPALPHTTAPSQAGGSRSHQVCSLERGAQAAAEGEAEAAAEAEPGAEALMEGTDAGMAAEAARPANDWRTRHRESTASEVTPGCRQAEQDEDKSSAYSHASSAKQDACALCTSSLSLPGMAAAATAATPMQDASGGSPLPLAPTTTTAAAAAAATAAAMSHPQLSASEQAQAAGPVTADYETDAAASAGATAVAFEAETVVLEAVSAAAAMAEAFPHLLDNLGEALATNLRCAIGELCRPSCPHIPHPPGPSASFGDPLPQLPRSVFTHCSPPAEQPMCCTYVLPD